MYVLVLRTSALREIIIILHNHCMLYQYFVNPLHIFDSGAHAFGTNCPTMILRNTLVVYRLSCIGKCKQEQAIAPSMKHRRKKQTRHFYILYNQGGRGTRMSSDGAQ
uniref:Uncharacterized protein n=1 Tax=Leersia perrieri TaxID=77586 RepID=A0A0D9XYS1_9ORYZ